MAKGLWWSRDVLSKPDFDLLRDREDFKRTVERREEAKNRAITLSRPELTVLTPGDREVHGRPLTIALHGGGGNARGFRTYWSGALEQGIVLAFSTSSRPLASNSYSWDDEATAEKEIRDAYVQVQTRYSPDRDKTVLAGFS